MFNENLGLDIKKYNLTDLLSLFKMPINFTREHLIAAKRIVMKTHPDKSSLDKKFFLFFSAAYKLLYSTFIGKVTNRSDKVSYDPNDLKENGESDGSKKTNKIHTIENAIKFNETFNRIFETHCLKELGADEDGHGNWLKSNDDYDTSKTSQSNMNSFFEEKKKEKYDMIIKPTINYVGSGSGYDLINDSSVPYSSNIFSQLQFDDVKRAYVESIVPVSGDTRISNRPISDNDMNNYTNERNNIKYNRNPNDDVNMRSLSDISDIMFEDDTNRTNQIQATKMAFLLAKQDEAFDKMRKNITSSSFLLTN